MESPEGCHDVAALQPGPDAGAGERSPVNGSLVLIDTDEEDPPSAASLLGLSGPIESRLQLVLDWFESPSSPDTPDWVEFTLASPQFEEFEKLYQLGYFSRHNLHYDYSADEQILAFRMLGAGHECVLNNLVVKISQSLANAAARDDITQSAREFASLPTSEFGSATVLYPPLTTAGERLTQRDPDAQFIWNRRRDSSLIIEVAWTQSTKKLQKLAYDYILGSDGDIRTVVGFDIDPSAGKGATVKVWRAVHNGDNIDVACDLTEIRSASGVKNPDPEAGLRLTLEDFAYSRGPAEYPDLDSVVMFIPMDDLYEILERAEGAQADRRHLYEELLAKSRRKRTTAKQSATHGGYSMRPRAGRGIQKK